MFNRLVVDIDKLSPPFLKDVWTEVRPFLVKLIKDWIIAVSLWLSLWCFRRIVGMLPIYGWPGAFIEDIHSVGTVAAYGLFVGLFLYDILKLSSNKGSV